MTSPHPDPRAPFSLVRPDRDHLPHFRAALEQGWSPDTLRGREGAMTRLAEILCDPDGFLYRLNAEDPNGAEITLPDGTRVPRLPNRTRWIWSDGFAGQISLRWQPGTDFLPPTCLGHIGYAVLPERQGRGLATRALATILEEASDVGLSSVEITCRPTNPASRRVIERNGGQFEEEFRAPKALGGHVTLRFRIAL